MRLSKRTLVVLSLAIPALIVALVAGFMVHGAAAANTASHASGASVVTVTPSSVDGVHWSTADTRSGGASSFVLGPGHAPMGAGSLQMTSDSTPYGSSQAKAQMFSYGYIGTSLANLTSLSYSDYRSSSSTTSSATRVSLNIEVDVYDNAGNAHFTTLVYEPYEQSGATLQNDTWQTWDALGSGLWWSTHTLTGRDETITKQSDTWTWDHMMYEFPGAVIVGGLGFNIGSGWDGKFSGNADALAVGVSGKTTTYNFEPDTSICKDGGWQTLGFKNQGDCVSFIASGGKNPGK